MLTLAPSPAPAAAAAAEEQPTVAVIQLGGLIDPVLADFIGDAIADAGRSEALALVMQLDSTDGVLSRRALDRLVFEITHAPVPVAVWVGPARKGRALGQAGELVEAAAIAGVAPGAQVEIGGRRFGSASALAEKLVAINAPTLGDFLVSLDDAEIRGGTRLDIPSDVIRRPGRPPQRQPDVRVQFAKPSLLERTLHAVASPPVAYGLLVGGLLLMVLEFFTAGVGVAAATGAILAVLSAYGLGVLPTRPWAVALVLLGVFGLAVDLQAGTPRVWTWIGTIALAAGSVKLYDGVDIPLVWLVGVLAGALLFMVAGMPTLVRTRFSTPTIGRESMLGEVGVASAAIDPEGIVEVRGAPWRARTNRATPIAAGNGIRVVGIDGLLLEVEPEEGGARDYRDHRPAPST